MLEANRSNYALPSAQPVVLQAQTPVSPPASTGPMAEVKQQVKLWSAIAARKDFAAYEAFYAPSFMPADGMTRVEWANAQKARFAQIKNMPAEVKDIKVRMNGLDRASAEFVQDFDDKMQPVATRKKLEFIKSGSSWLIDRESSAPAGTK